MAIPRGFRSFAASVSRVPDPARGPRAAPMAIMIGTASIMGLALVACGPSDPAKPPQTFTVVCTNPDGSELFRENGVRKGDVEISQHGARVKRPGESENHRFGPAVPCRSIPNPR